MIQKVTIEKVYKNDTKRDGSPYIISKGTHAGKNFIRVGIQTNVHGEKTYYNNALLTDRAANIEVGQSLLLNFEEKVEGDKTWHNFNFPTKEQLAKFAEEVA